MNLYCNSNFPEGSVCPYLTQPRASRASTPGEDKTATSRAGLVSLGAQTDSRERVSPIFSMTPASCGLQFEGTEVSDSF